MDQKIDFAILLAEEQFVRIRVFGMTEDRTKREDSHAQYRQQNDSTATRWP
jgi:hypothetical protein